jgi:hypothetical protein
MSDNNGSAAGGQPGANGAGGEGGAAGGQGAGAGGATPWFSTIEDTELRGFAELKKWGSPADAVKSYRELEKFQGLPPDRLAKVPDKDDAEGWKAFNSRFGWAAPADPKEYALPVPDGHGRDFADAMQTKFHELGVPKELGQKIAAAANEFTLGKMAADDQAIELEHQQQLTQLKTEWGGNFTQLQQLADRASDQVVKSGWLSAEQMEGVRDVLGTAAFMKLFANLGSQQGEAKFVESGDPASAVGAMTPEAAKVRLKQLTQDQDWQKRFQSGGVRERQEYQQLRHIVAVAASAPGQ